MRRLRFAIAVWIAIAAGCAPAVRRTDSRPRPEVRASSAPLPPSPSPATAGTTHCDPSHPVLEGFTADEGTLAAARSSAAPVAHRRWSDGTLRFEIPAAWFPSRRHERDEILYRVFTGDADDVVAIHRGRAPPIRLGAPNGFRVVRGGIAIRGGLETDPTGAHRIEAIAVIPCEANPYVTMWARVRSADHLDAVVDLVRSIATGPDEPSPLREVSLDPTRDRAAALALAGRDAVARELVERGLANGMRARYPLGEVHPLADQLIAGRITVDFGRAPAEVLVSLPVQRGQLVAPAAYRGLHDPALPRAITELVADGCETNALQLAFDGIALRCRDGRDYRVIDDRDVSSAWADGIRDVDRFVLALARWRDHPDQFGGWPVSLCGSGAFAIEHLGEGEVARTERCTLGLDLAHGAITSASFSGSCAEIPNEPWSEPFRRAVRLDEIRGTANGPCTYTLGWNGRSSYALAAGDGGTASAPIASGPSLAVDRRAVHTAVAFLVDLERYLTGRTTEAPSNVLPSVLASIGAASPGDAHARELARRLVATAASGPGVAVLSARALDAQRVAVRFLALETELTEASRGWVVTTVRVPTAAGATPSVSPSPDRTR